MNAVDQGGLTPLNLARGRTGHANPAIESLLLAAGATAGAEWVAGIGDNDEEDDGEDEEGGDDD